MVKITDLPARTRLALHRADILYYRMIGCSYQTIAEELGVSASTVRSYLLKKPPSQDEESLVLARINQSKIEPETTNAITESKPLKQITSTHDKKTKTNRIKNALRHLEDNDDDYSST